MLTSSASQYLHPDYLQPLPTTLDAKKSPLALLAQTCSSIGKDTSPSKSIIPPLDSKNKDRSSSNGRKSESPGVKTNGTEERKSPRSTGDIKREGGSPGSESSKSGFRAPPPKDIPPLVPISSVQSDKSRSPAVDSSPRSHSRDGTQVTNSVSQSVTASSSLPPSAGGHNSHISLNCGSLSLEVKHQEAAMALSKSMSSIPSSHSHSISSLTKPDGLPPSAALPPSIPGYPGLPILGHSLPMDPATASHLYQAGLSAGHHGHYGLSSAAAAAHKGVGSSPYVAYARVKTSAGATTLVPICRDPYCTNCQITMQNAQLSSSSSCGAGCTQCTHEKSIMTSVPSSLPTSMGMSGLPVMSHLSAREASSLASLQGSLPGLYSHAFGVMPGHHGLPYVCNWVAGSDYCGKRFTTSEELLQHLRTHTSASDTAAALHASALSPYASLGLAACHSHIPGSMSPNSLRQAYPRTLSPNSILAASRFHPYKSPLSGLPTAPQLPGAPSLSAYYSPYAALYGQRLGAVAP